MSPAICVRPIVQAFAPYRLAGCGRVIELVSRLLLMVLTLYQTQSFKTTTRW